MQPVVHHVELCVRDGGETLQSLQKFGFRPFAERETPHCKQWAAKLGGIIFVVTQRQPHYVKHSLTQGSVRAEPLTVMCCENEDCHTVDTVFNVALAVKNVSATTERIASEGGVVVQAPTTLEDEHGSVSYSIIRSCCGNVLHSLINKDKYSKPFLPGFKPIECVDSIEHCMDGFSLNKTVSHIDHVTLACHAGDSQRVISWYESCFGMQRFSISSNDDDDEGLILDDGVGLRLRAMEYWRCAETGLVCQSFDKTRERHLNGVMLVVVESLPGQKNCNVETFLREHQGPGVEHIAFSTRNMFQAVESMKHLGVYFRQPPAAYYKQLKKLKQIEQIGENLKELERLGILLDSEVEPGPEKDSEIPKYLMQIFAHPLFSPSKTFFIEVIQRSGARGLGAGNIIALVRSIREDEKRKAVEEEKRKKTKGQEMKSLRGVC